MHRSELNFKGYIKSTACIEGLRNILPVSYNGVVHRSTYIRNKLTKLFQYFMTVVFNNNYSNWQFHGIHNTMLESLNCYFVITIRQITKSKQTLLGTFKSHKFEIGSTINSSEPVVLIKSQEKIINFQSHTISDVIEDVLVAQSDSFIVNLPKSSSSNDYENNGIFGIENTIPQRTNSNSHATSYNMTRPPHYGVSVIDYDTITD